MQLSQQDIKELDGLYKQLNGTTDFTLFAVGGKEGDRFTYVAKIPFGVLAEQYDLVPDAELSTNLKLQRDLVVSRSRNIANYIGSNGDFIFPELISISESIIAEQLNAGNVFKITIPSDAFRYLVDGQGRLSGIKRELKSSPELAEHCIDIKFIVSEGIKRDTQIFADVNQTPISPNKSQCVAMDNRMVINRFAKVVSESTVLKSKIDFTKASVTNSSNTGKLWTLNQMVSFITILTGTTNKSSQEKLADEATQKYWLGFISRYLEKLQMHPGIKAIFNADEISAEFRSQTVIGTSVFLKSVALLGKIIVMNVVDSGQKQVDWSFFDKWASLDLSVDNKEWLGRCMNYRGRFEDKAFNHKATVSYLCEQLGLQVPKELESIEEEVLMARAQMLKAKREEAKQLAKEEAQ
ncbi:DNA sulfur modification protein DndB [Alteromonas gilva]|uniref:DNA sulfur modification protein DndB n=1 Tax=Alteromonas gilva TaxID=2987522 RepID=A0ABT5L7E3_9ALTE|nr:DNA sulfur modification protein DndB [Alteromonas gilva]MDC8832983.1 DNA sulfur modification protein DndB [Alteromonas gilva]